VKGFVKYLSPNSMMQNKPIIRFAALAIIALIIWVFFDSWFFADKAIMKSIQVQSAWMLNVFNEQKYTTSEITYENGVSKFGIFCQNSGMRVGKTCNGKSIMFMYAAFILIFPGIKLKRRLVYLVLGVLILHEFNVIRVALLAYILENFPAYFPSMHHYFFQVLVYVLIFLMVKKYINVNQSAKV
jgi:exosortase/archaeosortase family protein